VALQVGEQQVLTTELSAPAGNGSGPLLADGPVRLDITAMVDISSTTAVKGLCRARVIAESPSAPPAFAGKPSFFTLPGTAGDTDREVPIVASYGPTTGFTDVIITCGEESGSGATYDNGAVNALAIPE
jgi:hypothetical protein